MTTFNSAFDWASGLPPSISSLDENDFLLLLQKQFPSVNTAQTAPSELSKANSTDPQSLHKFQIPNSTSPLSTDSSPSPPSANDDGSLNGSDPNHNGHPKRDGSVDDDHHKRKASADDFDDEINGQPTAKSQHTDPKSKKLIQARRKSVGGEKSQDESRLLKRKEQNRAAQRAFRERKEKHVKDLEDKVAQLEAKTETQATENENLRDMLSRLQNENVMLKQTAFTFSVPSAPTGAAAPERSRDTSPRSSRDSLNLFQSSSSGAGPSRIPTSTAASSVTTPSTHDSPNSLFEGFDSFSGLNIPTSDTSDTSAPTSGVTTSPSTHDMDTMAFFGASGPFTTISSNPMFTSYRDPIQSMNAFASFGGWDGDINMTSSSDNTNAGLEELFGDQFSGLVPFSGDFLTGEGKSSPTPGSGEGAPEKPATSSTGIVHGEGCPKTKEDVERMIANGPKGTFGGSPMGDGGANSQGAPTPMRQNSTAVEYEAAFQQALGKTQTPKPLYSGDNFNIDELCLDMQRKAKCSFAAACT